MEFRADLQKCRDYGIFVISKTELQYYEDLVRLLKTAARYQLLAHVFTGSRVSGLERTVLATRAKMGGTTFYTFLIRPHQLLRIAYIGHRSSRDIDGIQTYQRMLQPKRLRSIAQYINNGGKFPTNIVLNLKPTKRIRFDKKENCRRRISWRSLSSRYICIGLGDRWTAPPLRICTCSRK